MNSLTIRRIDPWLLEFVRPLSTVLTVREADYVLG
jgi:hypothetical protein